MTTVIQPDTQATIELKSVSKLFRRQKQRTVKELIPALFGGESAIASFWALNDITATINKGETIGIIGPNGSGKSTLLKLIAGVSQPTRGSLAIHGKLAPLIELGAGFHPELTGRENVYLNGVILGMTRDEITSKFQAIVDFAELWEFIDEPVKHYSSGMYLRLAFAVAIHTDPDILLVDEILAVGDENFQNKCFKKIAEFKAKGVTIVIVSHSLKVVKEHCEKTLYLEHSHLVIFGPTDIACKAYRDSIAK